MAGKKPPKGVSRMNEKNLPALSAIAQSLLDELPPEMRAMVSAGDVDPDTESAGAALADVAGPWISEAAKEGLSDEDFAWMNDHLLGLATTAWNIAAMPDEESRRERMEEAHQMLVEGAEDDEEVLATWAETLNAMVTRKLALYPEDGRAILNYRLVEEDGEAKLYALACS